MVPGTHDKVGGSFISCLCLETGMKFTSGRNSDNDFLPVIARS